MLKINLLLTCLFSCLSLLIFAQDSTSFKVDESYSDDVKHREVIVNTTPLIAQFIPFNASNLSRFNLYDYEYRRFKNGKGWRFSLGVSASGGFNAVDPNSLYLRIGLIKRRQIASKFHFTRAWDVHLAQEEFDNNFRSAGKLGFSGLGLSYSPGIEYSITSRMSVSTEGILFLGLLPSDGIGGESILLKFIPPVGLFFHVKL
jgi:hypothetical protein